MVSTQTRNNFVIITYCILYLCRPKPENNKKNATSIYFKVNYKTYTNELNKEVEVVLVRQ